MARGDDAAELRDLLREELGARLAPAGWTPVEGEAGTSSVMAAFIRPLGGEFAATAEVSCASSVPDSLPLRVTYAFVGVSYEPLRRLWPLLGRFGLSVLAENVHDVDGDDDDEEEPETWQLEVSSGAQVADAADELAGLILEHAGPVRRALREPGGAAGRV